MQYIVCDIDGTVADCKHRLHYIRRLAPVPNDYDAFYEACDKDTPIKPIINILKRHWHSYSIVFLTGRRESVRQKTVDWLDKYVTKGITCNPMVDERVEYDLLMRPNGDRRHDTIVKPELLDKFFEGELFSDKSNVAFILEDRNSMVKEWRELGYTCLQVADGDF